MKIKIIITLLIGIIIGYLFHFPEAMLKNEPKLFLVDTVLINDTIYSTDTVCIDGYKDGFVEFLAKYEADSLFRIKRVKFPLLYAADFGDCGENHDTIFIKEDEIDTIAYWRYRVLSAHGYNWTFYKGFNSTDNNENRRRVHISLDETGVNADYYFEYIDEKWYLVAIYNISC